MLHRESLKALQGYNAEVISSADFVSIARGAVDPPLRSTAGAVLSPF
jgi:hypothetical protein